MHRRWLLKRRRALGAVRGSDGKRKGRLALLRWSRHVLHLGDADSRERVLAAIQALTPRLEGTILSVDQPALFRSGVDPVPSGAVAYDPTDRSFL